MKTPETAGVSRSNPDFRQFTNDFANYADYHQETLGSSGARNLPFLLVPIPKSIEKNKLSRGKKDTRKPS